MALNTYKCNSLTPLHRVKRLGVGCKRQGHVISAFIKADTLYK